MQWDGCVNALCAFCSVYGLHKHVVAMRDKSAASLKLVDLKYTSRFKLQVHWSWHAIRASLISVFIWCWHTAPAVENYTCQHGSCNDKKHGLVGVWNQDKDDIWVRVLTFNITPRQQLNNELKWLVKFHVAPGSCRLKINTCWLQLSHGILRFYDP